MLGPPAASPVAVSTGLGRQPRDRRDPSSVSLSSARSSSSHVHCRCRHLCASPAKFYAHQLQLAAAFWNDWNIAGTTCSASRKVRFSKLCGARLCKALFASSPQHLLANARECLLAFGAIVLGVGHSVVPEAWTPRIIQRAGFLCASSTVPVLLLSSVRVRIRRARTSSNVFRSTQTRNLRAKCS